MCTNLSIPNSNEKSPYTVTARTMDFGPIKKPIPTSLYPNMVMVPRGQQFPTSSRLNEHVEEWVKLLPQHPLTWENTYGFVGIDIGPHILNCINIPIDKFIPIYLDGINEKGLSAASLWLNGSHYQKESDTPDNLMFLDVMAFALGTCADVNEVKQALKKVNVVCPDKELGKYPAHYVFTDTNPQNKTLIVEYIDGKALFYESENGVLTNEPPYPEQLKNLEHYAGMSIYNKEIDGEKVPGLLNLPADASPTSRFVRASKFTETNYRTSLDQDAVGIALQIIQNLEVPAGTVVDRSTQQMTDLTQWLVVRDHTELCYYYKTDFNQSIQRIDLNQLNFGATHTSQIQIKDGPWFIDQTNALIAGKNPASLELA